MRGSQEKYIHPLGGERLPTEGLERKAAIAADVGVKLIEPCGCGSVAFAREQHGLLYPRMAKEKSRQLETGIARGANHGGLDGSRHQARIASSRDWSPLAFLLFPEMIRMVSSPATVPTTSPQPSPSMATATGCALPGMVLTTSRFCARRISRTNSRTTRETAGSGSAGASSPGST